MLGTLLFTLHMLHTLPELSNCSQIPDAAHN